MSGVASHSTLLDGLRKKVNFTSLKLRILVVGGGVGGLSAALSLRLYGHDVTVVEKFSESEAIEPDSGGIRCPPNMTRLFKFDPHSLEQLRRGGTECSGLQFFDGQTAELVGDMAFPAAMLKDLGSPFVMAQRGEYTQLAYNFCVQHGVKFIFSTAVTSIDTSKPHQVNISLSSGQSEVADLVVGADGCSSFVRSVVVGRKDDEPSVGLLSGASVSIPVESMLKDPDLAPLCDSRRLNIWMGIQTSITGGMHGSHYDINFLSAVHHHGMHDLKRRLKFSVADFSSYKISDFEPRIRKLVTIGSSCYFTTQRLYALTHTVNSTSRVVLIGDASRAPPIHGTHNSANALEDASVLGELLSHLTDQNQLPRLMRVFEEIREPRTAETQKEQMRGHVVCSMSGAEKEARDASFRLLLQMQQAGQEIDDEILAVQWADHLKAFDYDSVDAVSEWWLKWGRYMKEMGGNLNH